MTVCYMNSTVLTLNRCSFPQAVQRSYGPHIVSFLCIAPLYGLPAQIWPIHP